MTGLFELEGDMLQLRAHGLPSLWFSSPRLDLLMHVPTLESRMLLEPWPDISSKVVFSL
jgi:hypothetical protein